MHNAFTFPESEKLAKLCAMFSSEYDGERANAAAMADRLLKSHGYTWDQALFQPTLPAKPRRVWSEGHSPSQVAYECLKWLEPLTEWEQDFLRSIAGRHILSDKQRNVLARIKVKCRTYAESCHD